MQRRWVRLGRMLLASVVCVLALVVVSQIVGHSVFPVGPRRPPGGPGSKDHYGIGGPFPTAADLGVIAAWLFMDARRWLPRWRRVGYVVLTLGVLARLGVSLTDPATIIMTLVVAGVATQAVQLALGAPNTKPRAANVGRILTDLGYRITAVERYRGFRGFTGFRVRHADGTLFYVKIVGRDSWATLLPVRLYHAARFREGPEDGPFRSVRASVEHEALCALKAHSDGVPTPRLAVVAEFPPNAMLMAFDVGPVRAPVTDGSRPPAARRAREGVVDRRDAAAQPHRAPPSEPRLAHRRRARDRHARRIRRDVPRRHRAGSLDRRRRGAGRHLGAARRRAGGPRRGRRRRHRVRRRDAPATAAPGAHPADALPRCTPPGASTSCATRCSA